MVPGQTLGGRYVLIREIGRGGMGMVFEAHDPVLERDVAIKALPDRALGHEERARLRREARIVAKMDHPCVVPVFDLVDDQDGLYLVMPVLRGSTLRELLHGGPLTAQFAATVGLQIASALEYSHELGVIHRDIKPDNVMTLGPSQGTLTVKLMDFGVARTLEDTTEVQPGGVIGTIEYLSPEQVRGLEVGAPSDVYALGVLLYECLLGQPPFTGSMMDVMHRILDEAPKPLCELEPNVPEVLETLIARCLQKSPASRPSLRSVQKSLSRVPLATVAPRARNTSKGFPAARPPPLAIANQTTAPFQPPGLGSEIQGRDQRRTPLAMVDAIRQHLQVAELAYRLGQYDDAIEHCATARRDLGDQEPLLQAMLLSRQALAHAAARRFAEADDHVSAAFAALARHTDSAPAGRQVVLAQLFRAQSMILFGHDRPLAAQ